MKSLSLILTAAGVSSICAVLMPNIAHAQQKVTIKNVSRGDAQVYWSAAGCAGVVDGRTLVCHDTKLSPGEKRTYEYKWGTTSRRLSFKSDRCVTLDNPKWSVKEDKDGEPKLHYVTDGCDISTNPNSSGGEGTFIVKNKSNESATVYFRAFGCVNSRGVDMFPLCGSGKGLWPGESLSVRFPEGVSKRSIAFDRRSCALKLDGLKEPKEPNWIFVDDDKPYVDIEGDRCAITRSRAP